MTSSIPSPHSGYAVVKGNIVRGDMIVGVNEASILLNRLEEQLDALRVALDRGAADYVGLLEQLEASTRTWLHESNKRVEAEMERDGLKEQLDALRVALDRGAADYVGLLEQLQICQDNSPTIGAAYLRLKEQFESLHAAATEMLDFLWHEKETREPSTEDLDAGYVALELSKDYEREEELGEKLGRALGRDPLEVKP